MRGQDPNAMALLPILGLSACVASTGMDASTSPDQLRASAQEPTWIEPAVERDPMTLLEAAVVAGETSLAAGEFEAARELQLQEQRAIHLLGLAQAHDPSDRRHALGHELVVDVEGFVGVEAHGLGVGARARADSPRRVGAMAPHPRAKL